jgi:hypothetical protein
MVVPVDAREESTYRHLELRGDLGVGTISPSIRSDHESARTVKTLGSRGIRQENVRKRCIFMAQLNRIPLFAWAYIHLSSSFNCVRYLLPNWLTREENASKLIKPWVAVH